MENNNNSAQGIVELLKKNMHLIKGIAAILLGAYFVSLKYYVVMDFLMLALGVVMVFYGFVCLRFEGLRDLLQHQYFSINYWFGKVYGKDNRDQ